MHTHENSPTPETLLPQGFEFAQIGTITPQEILAVREETVTPEEEVIWQKCLHQSLGVVGVRDQATEQLVGIGRLSGDQRHAQLVDITVRTNFREQGIGAAIVDELVAEARRQQIKYVGLTYAKNKPWLKDFYTKHGFEPIDFGMWLTDSLNSI